MTGGSLVSSPLTWSVFSYLEQLPNRVTVDEVLLLEVQRTGGVASRLFDEDEVQDSSLAQPCIADGCGSRATVRARAYNPPPFSAGEVKAHVPVEKSWHARVLFEVRAGSSWCMRGAVLHRWEFPFASASAVTEDGRTRSNRVR